MFTFVVPAWFRINAYMPRPSCLLPLSHPSRKLSTFIQSFIGIHLGLKAFKQCRKYDMALLKVALSNIVVMNGGR